MSQAGIELVASIFSQMQEVRIELLQGDKEDILLGQLLDVAKDAVKDKFARITLEKTPRQSPNRSKL